MFKNLMLFRVAPQWAAGADHVDNALSAARFAPCGSQEALSIGWSAPRGVEHGPLVEAINGQYLMRLMVEEKILPASVVKRRVEEIAAKIEQDTGRRPGRKQLKDIKEDVTQGLLPMAFTKRTGIAVWLDPATHLLAIDATSKARAGQVVTALVNALEGLGVTEIQTQQSPAGAMAAWLLEDEAPAGFTVDMDCELKSADEMKSVLRYARHSLDTEEIRQHVRDGLMPTKLALTWSSRVSFLLTDTLQLKRLQFLDVVFENNPNDADDSFDADAAIATAELAPLVADLVEALGGEQPAIG